MADYGININVQDYMFKLPVYYTNPVNRDRRNVIIRMVLDDTNFTFGYTKLDGSDIRLAEQQDGTKVLHMWIAYKSTKKNYMTLYFKLPTLRASETITLWFFFGSLSATSVSNPDEIGFIFYEDFKNYPLSSSKWSGTYTNNYISLLGYYLDKSLTNTFFGTICNPMQNKTNWIIEFGTYIDGAIRYTNDTARAFSIGLSGENPFVIKYIAGGGIVHNASSPNQASTVYIQGINHGPEPYSYQENFIAYDDSQPIIYQRSFDRNTYPDDVNVIYRNIDGDTVVNNILICGGYSSAYIDYGACPSYIAWLVVRELDAVDRVLLDCSTVNSKDRLLYPSFDFNDYGDDITNVSCAHETSFGGDPLLLSDDSTETVWVSNTNATLQPYISTTIHFGTEPERITDINKHYDSGHVKYFGASKLSDDDADPWGRNFWDCPTVSGWASIKFNNKYAVNSFIMTPVYESETMRSNYPKDYIFYGSNYNPLTNFGAAKELCFGTFKQAFVPQQVFFNSFAEYKYYILYIVNNYGGNNIRIQELRLYYIPKTTRAVKVSQLRLLPHVSEFMYNFPNEISLQASVDLITWITVMPWTFTYSPFMEYYSQHLNVRSCWQPYQFVNNIEQSYWAYRLLCRGNWGAENGKIAVVAWEFRELIQEANTFRVMEGASNNIRQVWTSAQCGINDVNNTIYAANDKLNYIIGNYSYAFSDALPTDYYDINVINGV